MKKIICFAACACLCACALPLSACGGNQDEDISSYEIYATYDADAKTLTSSCAFSYYNDTENEITALKFNLYGNAYREGALYPAVSENYTTKAYYNGKNYGEMDITSVENCASWEIAGEDENILTVNLTEAVYPEERTKITINYTLALAEVNHRTGVSERAVNLGNFYPILCVYGKQGFVECPYYSCGDPFLSDCANYKVTFDMPSGYICAASGEQASETIAGGRKKCSFSGKNMRDFAAVLSDEFSVITRETDGVTINYYYYNDDSPQTCVNVATESVSYFSSTFGAYVYPVLSVVQTGFCYGGMEYPALVMISDECDSDTNIYTTVHEIAHQWWYAMVGSDQIENAWQDEGLAEYSALMFFENFPEYAFTRTSLVGSATKAYRAYFSVYNQIFGNVNTAMTRSLSSFTGEYEYTNIAYNKGLILFDMLRTAIGDENFCAALKKYYDSFLYRRADPADLVECFSTIGTDVQGFFNSFLEGKIII